MTRRPLLVLATLFAALVAWSPRGVAQAVPDGVSASDWADICAARRAPRDAQRPGAIATKAADAIAQQAYLKASNSAINDHFGWSVAASGDTVAVSAIDEDSNAIGVNGNQANDSSLDSGAVYVFVRNNGIWSQQAYIKAGVAAPANKFGWSVALEGDTLAVGARGGGFAPATAGDVYIFLRGGNQWTQQAHLTAPNAEASDIFGDSVALSGNTLVIGAPLEDGAIPGVNGDQLNNGAADAGAAYVFIGGGPTWFEQAYLKASNPGAGDQFGRKLAISGDTIVVGASLEDSNASGVDGDGSNNGATGAGAAYVFARSGTTWSQQAYLKASNVEAADGFGWSVAASGDTVVVGANGEDGPATGVNGNQASDAAPGSGAAYVFVRTGSTWNQQAYLKASNTGPSDGFGHCVAIAGDTIVAGAPNESSDATGIDGDGSNNAAPGAGAAYSFVRSGTNWTPQAYVKASNTGTSDSFGIAVAISGGTLIVGGYVEDSNATGVNGDGTNNSFSAAGAAYVFTLPGSTTWTNMGSGLAGVTGIPVFVGSGTLAASSSNSLGLSGAAFSAPAAMFVALSSTPVPFKGGTLLPIPVLTMVSLGTIGGAITLPFVMPPGVPAGTQLWFQWAIHDAAAVQGVALSNAVRGTTP